MKTQSKQKFPFLVLSSLLIALQNPTAATDKRPALNLSSIFASISHSDFQLDFLAQKTSKVSKTNKSSYHLSQTVFGQALHKLDSFISLLSKHELQNTWNFGGELRDHRNPYSLPNPNNSLLLDFTFRFKIPFKIVIGSGSSENGYQLKGSLHCEKENLAYFYILRSHPDPNFSRIFTD